MNKDTLTEKLQNERMIFMEGDFNEENCQMLTKRILYLYHLNQKSDIIIYIDSYGGEVCSFLQLYNLIESLSCNIHTIAMGKSMSAGAYLLLSGSKGKRFAYKNTQIMLHELAFSRGYNKLHDQKVSLEYSKKLMDVLYSIVKDKTKINNIKNYLKEDKYLTAKEALSLGIIDGIIGDENE